MTRIEIVVDELILRGVPPEQSHAVKASLEARLGVLAAQSDAVVPARAEASRRLRELETTTAALGDSVADAIWDVLAGGER